MKYRFSIQINIVHTCKINTENYQQNMNAYISVWYIINIYTRYCDSTRYGKKWSFVFLWERWCLYNTIMSQARLLPDSTFHLAPSYFEYFVLAVAQIPEFTPIHMHTEGIMQTI